MTDRRKHDDPLAGLTARMLAAGSARAGDVCPDPEILAAFFDRSLPAVESARLELHFSQCNRCQEQLAVLARMEPAARPSEQPQAQGFTWLWNWRWLAPAVAALGVLAIWVVLRPIENVAPTSSQSVATTAENRQPPSKLNDEPALRTDQPAEGESAKKQGVPATPQSQYGRLEANAKLADQNAPLAPLQMKPSPSDADALAKDRDQAAAAPTPLAEPQQEAQARPAETKDRTAEMQIAGRAQQQAAQPAEKREAQFGALRSGPVANQDGKLAQAPAPMLARAPESDQKAQEAEEAKKSKVAEAAPAADGSRARAKSDAAAGFRANESASRYATVLVAGTRTLWRVGPEGSIERSDDTGSTWQRQMSGISVDLLAGSAPSATVCWVVGRGGVVLRTTDGTTWAQIGSPSSTDLVSVEARDANQATVTTADGKRYATSDGGRTWRSL